MSKYMKIGVFYMVTFLGLSFTAFIIWLLLVAIHIYLIVWAYRDALNRGNNTGYALLVAAAVFFFPVIGIVLYLILRERMFRSKVS
jgi:hypothetical protein